MIQKLRKLLDRMLGRNRPPAWIDGLDSGQRRLLVRNLKRITEAKRAADAECAISAGAPPN